jgi:TolB protein
VAVVAIAVVVSTLTPSERPTPVAATLPPGTILVGEWDQRISQARWFTVRTDGTGRSDLHLIASCAEWFPNGDTILITDDAAFTPESPLRPAVVDADGSNLRPLDAIEDPGLNLGCGDVSPDGRRIVVEGFNDAETERQGIYSMRASDGGDLVRLTSGFDAYPQFSPDGTHVVFLRTKPGVQPDGAGALFVVDVSGGRADRITPWGTAFLDQGWSPTGEWIVFQRPYGQLFLIRPDGTDLHRVPVRLPQGAGARSPSWSPDGEWIVLSMQRANGATIWATRVDGSDLRPVTTSRGVDETLPDWSS